VVVLHEQERVVVDVTVKLDIWSSRSKPGPSDTPDKKLVYMCSLDAPIPLVLLEEVVLEEELANGSISMC
jgi:hypothetical protein